MAEKEIMLNNKQLPINNNKVLWVLGLLGAQSGAFLLWNGSLLGEDAASPSRPIGIIAISAAAANMRRERK
jgi:hypothetical protein